MLGIIAVTVNALTLDAASAGIIVAMAAMVELMVKGRGTEIP